MSSEALRRRGATGRDEYSRLGPDVFHPRSHVVVASGGTFLLALGAPPTLSLQAELSRAGVHEVTRSHPDRTCRSLLGE